MVALVQQKWYIILWGNKKGQDNINTNMVQLTALF